MRISWLMAIAIVCAGSGCSSKESEENARKAALYDSLQLQAAGKQQKLEECMTQAQNEFQRRRNAFWEQLGCEKYGNAPPSDIVTTCNQATDYAKQSRIVEEDRCVKLYK